MAWQCFMIAPVDRAEESLRRYAGGSACDASGVGYHNASVVLGESDFAEPYNGRSADDLPHDDPRWPQTCACGYTFAEADEWQHNINRIYEGSGYRGPLGALPAGAMYDAAWMPDYYRRGTDGRALIVILPDGTPWTIDGPASNSDTGWDRSGEPPLITASPSIDSGGYHGFLQNGALTDDLGGRTYQPKGQ